MNQTTELNLSFDSLLKGAVFILGGLFLGYCVLNALFGEWWALFIARLFVSMVLAGLVALAVTAAYQRLRLNKHLADARIQKARAASGFAVIQDPKGTQQVIYDHRNNSWLHYFKPNSAKLLEAMTERQPDPLQVEKAQDLEPIMDYISDAQSLVLIGSQGSGKTTLLQHLIDHRLSQDACVVIDPHGYAGKYPTDQIAGQGRNYQQIDDVLAGMVSEMHRRYEDYGSRASFTPSSIFVDEYTLLTRNCPNAAPFLESALTEFRKVRMKFVLCLHSRRSKFLGLKGSMDLAEGIIFCTLKKQGRDRWAEVELEDGQTVKCSLPGPYHGGGPGPGTRGTRPTHGTQGTRGPGFYAETPDSDEPCTVSEVYSIPMDTVDGDDKEREIVRRYRLGETLSQIAEAVFGSRGGRQYQLIKAVLSERGIITQ